MANDLSLDGTWDANIVALLDRRLEEAEIKFLTSPEVKRFRAEQEHMLMNHGTMETCTCPGWNLGRY